jgi:hypothetical protein
MEPNMKSTEARAQSPAPTHTIRAVARMPSSAKAASGHFFPPVYLANLARIGASSAVSSRATALTYPQ